MKQNVLIVGLGEIGRPLYNLIAAVHNVFGIDPKGNLGSPLDSIDVMHICYPFKDSFEALTVDYIKKYSPKLTILNSTVTPGTTKRIYEATNSPIVHSPIRGRHSSMSGDLRRYAKFVGAPHIEFSSTASNHFQSLGLKTRIASSARSTELMKLLSTTYCGILIGWAQEMNRICKKFDCDYDEIMSFAEEIDQFIGGRPKYTYGPVPGHCILPNAKLLNGLTHSDFITTFLESDKLRKEELKDA